MSDIILPQHEVVEMIHHWAVCPDNGYHGLRYGGRNIIKRYLDEPTDELAFLVIEKLKADVAYFNNKPISIKVLSANSFTASFGDNSNAATIEI